ncbi:MAG: GHMP kinase [Sphaerobacter sp.]|nr:GHMP kinase [Sphaerobacter sp.]
MVIVRAPVRISFGGGGTDLPAYYRRYGGLVVSAAIDRYAYVVARRPVDGGVHLASANYGRWEHHPPGRRPPLTGPLALPRAAVAWFAEAGLLAEGVDLFVASEVPPGTGLGSSSAVAVALTQALSAYAGLPLAPGAAAEIACGLEIDRLGMPIGKQDQYASAFGRLNVIEFAADGVRVQPLGLPGDVAAALAARLLLFSTGRTRHAARLLAQQRADTETRPATIAALHRLKALAAAMAEALTAHDLDRFGCLLDRAWQAKQRVSRRVSTPEIDRWYAAAREAGALGGKITGAGGGGFLLLYCPPRRQGELRAALAALGLRELRFAFDHDGARLIADPEATGSPIAGTAHFAGRGGACRMEHRPVWHSGSAGGDKPPDRSHSG